MSEPLDTRLHELVAERLTRPLTPEEEHELAELGDAALELELAAAAALLAFHEGAEAPTLPNDLRDRVLERTPDVRDLTPPPRRAPLPERSDTVRKVVELPRPARTRSWAPLALAAGLLLAALAALGLYFLRKETTAPPSLAELERAPGTLRWVWAPAGDPLVTTIAGEVVWNAERQAGFMRFRGLPRNDPAKNQYQLWIFDAQRDERYPVDGGVFDVASGEVVVPIDPKLFVAKPTLFAVTLEPPGGVVVSSREHLLVVAKPG